MTEDMENIEQTSASFGSASRTSSGPVGGRNYEVQQGDCIDSIAFSHGHFWQTIWNHSDNQQLKSLRKDPNVLLAGDRVFVPDLRPKQESAVTEERHRFKRKGVPAKLNVRFEFDGKPRTDTPFTVVMDGVVKQGQTDGDGWVRLPIAPNAREAKIVLRPKNSEPEEYTLQLGHLDPIDTISGQKARLANLGLFQGEVSAEATPDFTEAIKTFQAACGLNETGVADQRTQQKLKDQHGS